MLTEVTFFFNIAVRLYSFYCIRHALLALNEWIITNTVGVDIVISVIGIEAMLALRHPVRTCLVIILFTYDIFEITI